MDGLQAEIKRILGDPKNEQGKAAPELNDLYRNYRAGNISKDEYKARCKAADYAARKRHGNNPPEGATLNEVDILAMKAVLRGEEPPVASTVNNGGHAPVSSVANDNGHAQQVNNDDAMDATSLSSSVLGVRAREDDEHHDSAQRPRLEPPPPPLSTRHPAPPPPPPPPVSAHPTQPVHSVNLSDLHADTSGGAAVSSEPFAFPEPREPGNQGRQEQVITNAVQIQIRPGLMIYQYDVKFWFEQTFDDGGKKAKVPDGVAAELNSKLPALFGSPNHFAYDKSKIVYAVQSPDQVKQRSLQDCWSLMAGDQGHDIFSMNFKPESQLVTLKQVGDPLNMDELVDGRVHGPVFRKFLAAVDVSLADRLHKCVKGAYYDENQRAAWSAIREVGRDRSYSIWLGYRQTVVDTTNGPMLFVDTAATAMYAPTKLLDFIGHKLSISPSNLTFQKVKGCERNLKCHGTGKPKMTSTHKRMTYTFFGLDSVPMSEATFKDKSKPEGENICSVLEWWQTNYPNVRLQRLDLPMVCTNNKKDPLEVVRIPIELLSWAGG
mmetsp:Transcript_6788/g.11430  ORF Transcript_6788/g.11430 Transcript_6788/m.11430 type:complete len:548 (+) Transcript_6788:48-1691(+)